VIPPLPAGPYRTILADPPWPTMHGRSTYHRGKPQRHYPVMTVEEIAAMPVGDLSAGNAHLWIWGVGRILDAAYHVAAAWGFTPMTLVTWCKTGPPGMGYYVRVNTEHCLLATRGQPMVPDSKPLASWFTAPKRAHSRKPDEFYAIAEQVSPGPRLELFARRAWPGWDSWGSELITEALQ
jgi:N6-adenosine-specific RNA methylase IME4